MRTFYRQQATKQNNAGLPAEQMLAGLLQALVAPATQAEAMHDMRLSSPAQASGAGLSPNDLQNLKQKNLDNINDNKPKAYLNYVFFDKEFKFVEDGSGVKQVDGEPGQLETLSSGKVVARKNGYVYVYTSNESSQDMLFDNLGVEQISGPVLEETHYYPFGLTMEGISTTAPLKLTNNYKFNSIELNNKEFSDGSGLELYAAQFRGLDPQIGRWWQIDPKPNTSISPYATMDLNPILYSDLMGDTIIANTDGKIVDNVGGNDDFISTNNPLPIVTVTATVKTNNSNGNSSLGSLSIFSPGLPMSPIGYGTKPIDFPKIPKIEIGISEIGIEVLGRAIGTIGLVLLPANWDQPSSDHLPNRPPGFLPIAPPIPNAKDLPWIPGQSPGQDWVWKGRGNPESGEGNWVNPNGQKLHPDLQHPDPKGAHWGLKQPDGSKWDIFPDGRVEYSP